MDVDVSRCEKSFFFCKKNVLHTHFADLVLKYNYYIIIQVLLDILVNEKVHNMYYL